MKKLMTFVLLLAITTMSFAQKNEVKAIEKALKNSNFADAKSAVSLAEALMGNMDDKTKAKFYLLKAKALYANGAGTDVNIDEAITTLDELKDLESKIGKLKYTKEANEISAEMLNSFFTKANNAFNNKNFKLAAKRFEKVYKMSPKDTLYLYYAASSAVTAKDYDTALDYYVQLKNLGYTGIALNYYATNKESAVEETFANKQTRDLSINIAKTHNNPKDVKSESKSAEIVKNIALIYVSQGDNEKALGAMADARAENPDDLGLLLSEANVYLKMGNRDKFKELMHAATEKDPNNSELLYNLGVLAAEGGNAEESIKYYEKAISIDPGYADAYNNLAVVILEGEAGIVEEMNNLGTSSADNRKYDELKEKRAQLYEEAIPHLEKALELKTNIDTARTLMNIYSAMGKTDKYKEMKVKVTELEAAAAGGN